MALTLRVEAVTGLWLVPGEAGCISEGGGGGGGVQHLGRVLVLLVDIIADLWGKTVQRGKRWKKRAMH